MGRWRGKVYWGYLQWLGEGQTPLETAVHYRIIRIIELAAQILVYLSPTTTRVCVILDGAAAACGFNNPVTKSDEQPKQSQIAWLLLIKLEHARPASKHRPAWYFDD